MNIICQKGGKLSLSDNYLTNCIIKNPDDTSILTFKHYIKPVLSVIRKSLRKIKIDFIYIYIIKIDLNILNNNNNV